MVVAGGPYLRTFEHKPAEERHPGRDEAMADDESHIRALIERKQNGRWLVAHEHHSFPSKD